MGAIFARADGVVVELGETIGVGAFFTQLIGYGIYGYFIFQEKIRPNAASWFMWLVGGLVEYGTYNALEGSHWSTSALPLACAISVGCIFLVTAYSQVRAWRRREIDAVYHPPERQDFLISGCDFTALGVWLFAGMSALANFISVSTTIFTFIPIWRTTLAHGEEHPLPWITWTGAYGLMLCAVLIEGGDGLLMRLFYPGYYVVLHFSMVLLCYAPVRAALKA